MHAPQIDLKHLRETVRKGQFDEQTFELGKQIVAATSTQQGSKSHLQALSLTVELARELSRYEDAENLIRNLALSLLASLRSQCISDRVTRNSLRTKIEYQLVRQELWCILAYTRVCDDLGRSEEALAILALIDSKIREAIEAPDWPQDLKFRGTRARLHYYYGMMLRRRPADSLQHFRIAMDFVWERWENQRSKHPTDTHRLKIEYQYALDSVARVLAFGYAFTFMIQTRLNDASAVLRAAALVADRGPNRLLQLRIASLLCHVRRHESGYQPKLRNLLDELGIISQQLAAHPSHWARAIFESGLTLVALLRSSDPTNVAKRASYAKQLRDVIKQLYTEKVPDVNELKIERRFQMLWLRALQSEAEGRFWRSKDPVKARREFEVARRTLNNIQRLSGKSISPLQHWDGQKWIISALVEIELGNISEAERLLDEGRSDWETGPPWLSVLAHVRYAAVAATRGQFDKAHDLLHAAIELSRPISSEFAWVVNELQLGDDFVKKTQREFEGVANVIHESARPVEKVQLIIRTLLHSELERQRERFPNLTLVANKDKWYPDVAAASLGCNRRQLKEWLVFVGLSLSKPAGRPPKQVTADQINAK